ncbi:ABC transporter ATP-binding protein [Kitasatospora sp. NPDC036755]|uniref:ABC transporter ATP-binding protein n=1 Tax=Kitasatospora sp. NPDC036755 TaxID=3154600 RepID=UPI0033F78FBE
MYARGARANDDICLQVTEGEVVALLGHNGAGKTTLVNQVAGLAVPTSGRIRVAGHDPVAEPARARAIVSLMPQAHAPLAGVTPRQAITMLARIRGASRTEARAEADGLLSVLDAQVWADTPGDRLSGGIRRLTAYGMTAARAGRIMVLDEPTNDVDPVRRRLLWQDIAGRAAIGRAVLVVTHNIGEAETYADRVVILDAGRVVLQGIPAELRATHAVGLEELYPTLVGSGGRGEYA